MNVKKRIQRLRGRKDVRTRQLRTIAEAVGRQGRRGRHWVYTIPGRPPVIIPDHPTKPIHPGIVEDILDILEEDIE